MSGPSSIVAEALLEHAARSDAPGDEAAGASTAGCGEQDEAGFEEQGAEAGEHEHRRDVYQAFEQRDRRGLGHRDAEQAFGVDAFEPFARAARREDHRRACQEEVNIQQQRHVEAGGASQQPAPAVEAQGVVGEDQGEQYGQQPRVERLQRIDCGRDVEGEPGDAAGGQRDAGERQKRAQRARPSSESSTRAARRAGCHDELGSGRCDSGMRSGRPRTSS